MMNGEGPSVPITTLAGIQSLTDLLLELPLPTPLPGFTGQQSLLSHLRDSEEARRLLNAQDSILVPTLVDALGCTTTDHIEVKDGYYGGQPHGGQLSQLVQFLVTRNPGLFKGSVHSTSNMAGGDHHAATSPWMQRPCPATVVHPQQQQQQASFPGAASVSPCHPHSSQGNSPAYYSAVDHQAAQQAGRLMHKTLNVIPPKSPVSAYSPYAHTMTSSNQQHLPLHHNAISHPSGDALSSGLPDSPHMFSPSSVGQHVVNAQSSHTLHTFSNGNCVDPVALPVPKPNNRTENHIIDSLQQQQSNVTNLSANCSPFTLTPTTLNDMSLSSPSSSSSTPQHINNNNSSSVIVTPNAHLVNNSRNLHAEQVSNLNVTETNPTAPAILTNCENTDVSTQSNLKAPTPGASVQAAKPQVCNNEILRADAKPDNKVLNNSNDPPKPIKVFNKENDPLKQLMSKPVVVLSKLTFEDQVLAQKSVRQFTLKNQKAAGLVDLAKSPVKSKNVDSSFSSNKRRSSGSSEQQSTLNKTSLRKRSTKNNEYPPPASKKSPDALKTKRTREAESENDLTPGQGKKKSSSVSTDRAKKRRKTSQKVYIESSGSEAAGDNSNDDDFEDAPSPPPAVKQKKAKNKKLKKDITNQHLSVEDLMDTNTYQLFSRTVEAIFDAMEDIDFTAAVDEDVECPAEALIQPSQLHDLCNEAAKLKMLKAMNQFPPERLTRLLSILERNIIDGAKLLPIQNMEEQDEEEARLWLELSMERVMRSADSSLTALYIMTSPKMPEKVFLEDVIERIVIFIKFQLQNTVFPVFDPAYRLDPKSKDGFVGNIKQKRAHATKIREKSAIQLYNKLHEAVSLLAELLDLQSLTDTIILQVSTLGVSPFFVEGVNELQLNALRLVTSVFSRYDKHRKLILEDILASIARLPTSKRSLRNYRLNSEENIQMLSALVLQLIHSVVRLPEPEVENRPDYLLKEDASTKNEKTDLKVNVDKDVLITTSYDGALRTAINFLSVFLKKCGTKNEEMDYRPLFENFVQDLLSTVNKPEWPASELLLNVLGRLLVQNFSNKSMEMALRVASLDYLGVVAARLRKDAVTSQLRKKMIDDVIQRLVEEDEEAELSSKGKKSKNKKNKRDEIQILQKALLHYLDANTESDPALQCSRKFYIAQWYRDAAALVRQSDKTSPVKDPEKEEQQSKEKEQQSRNKGRSPKSSRLSRRRPSQVTYEEEEEEKKEEVEEEKEEKPKPDEDEVNVKNLALAEERKRFLLTVIKKQNISKANANEDTIDYETAELISRFLASKRHFSQSFDLYLSQILRVLSETAVAVRTKAMKCLTLVVEADPSILARPDMQSGVHGRLLDQSTSVREAAVDLVGKFILIRPELTSQYYQMLTDRILDTGVSVRKRVIKILKDVCLEQPDFPKTPEICVKIIRRVNDEDGIKKLVGEVFQSMWFSPVSERTPDRILQKVKNITHVVEACKDVGLEWFEQLLTNLLKNKEDNNYKSVFKACQQIVDCLVENVLQLEESSQNPDGGASSHLVACLTTLHLFSKIYPPFVVPHATTIQPYLSMRCNTVFDYRVLNNVAQTLELVVPLIEHPSETFLAQIEEDMVKLILRQSLMTLQQSCISCLGAVVNRVTHNYQLVRDCFQKFLVVLLGFKKEHEKNPENPHLKLQRPKLNRALCTVGLFCRHFDFDTIDDAKTLNEKDSLKAKVFEKIIYFNNHEDEDIRLKALIGLGFMMIRHYEFMLGPEVKSLYQYLLTSPISPSLKCQVLRNLSLYLTEEETRMIQKDAEWSKNSKAEDLKEMGDVTSGMASTVIQVYLKQILDAVLHTELNVRKVSLQVIQLILGQGLVHPVQIVPYLVCLGSDDEQVVRTKGDQLLQEIEKKYPGFIQMKAISGVRMSYKLQQLIQGETNIIRGIRQTDTPSSRNGFLYSVIRGTRQSRRAFLFTLMKLFDEQAKTPLTELLYIADNIVYFPYVAQDEPLFIMHQIDIMLSVSGSNLLQTFRESLVSRTPNPPSVEASAPLVETDDYDEDDDDYDTILSRLPEDTSVLQECIIASQGCILLLFAKQTLKEMYGFTDNKIQQYSPNEAAKVYERPLNRKSHVRFNPLPVIEFIKGDNLQGTLDDDGKEKMIKQYLNFKQLMLTIDPNEDDDDEDNQSKPVVTLSAVISSMTANAELKAESNSENPTPSVEKTKVSMTPKGKSPSHSRSHRKTPKSVKDKHKKKHKKKRKRVIDSDSDNSDSDPDYMDSS